MNYCFPKNWLESNNWEDWNTIFSDLFDFEKQKSYYLYTTVKEEDGKKLVLIDLPGYKKEDLKLKFEKKRLIVEGESELKGKLYKEFALNTDDYDVDSIDAKLKDGILKITIPLKKERKGKNIDIK